MEAPTAEEAGSTKDPLHEAAGTGLEEAVVDTQLFELVDMAPEAEHTKRKDQLFPELGNLDMAAGKHQWSAVAAIPAVPAVAGTHNLAAVVAAAKVVEVAAAEHILAP